MNDGNLSFWVSDPGGRRLGPVRFEVIRDLIKTGRLVGLDKVSQDGKTFVPLVQFPQIAQLFAQRKQELEEAEDRAAAQRINAEIGALKNKTIADVFGLSASDPIDSYRASFFAMVKRFYPDLVPSHRHASLRQAHDEMFAFLSRLMVQVEARIGKQPAPAPSRPNPTYAAKEFIGWERRADNRIYCEVVCTFANAAQMFRHKLLNIADGGFFLANNQCPPLGEQLAITLKFNDPPREIGASATVIWENAVDSFKSPRGFGCRFVSIAEDDKKFLQYFVKKALAISSGPGAAPQVGE